MKQIKVLLLSSLLFAAINSNAQAVNGNAPSSDFLAGKIVKSDNTTQDGQIKDNIRKRGEIIFTSAEGKQTKLKAADLSEVQIGNDRYVVTGDIFYKVIADGSRLRLLQKASSGPKITYNGTEPILIQEVGSINDYFVQSPVDKKLQLVRKKDFNKLFESFSSTCPTLNDQLKQGLKYEEIEKAVITYNLCN